MTELVACLTNESSPCPHSLTFDFEHLRSTVGWLHMLTVLNLNVNFKLNVERLPELLLAISDNFSTVIPHMSY